MVGVLGMTGLPDALTLALCILLCDDKLLLPLAVVVLPPFRVTIALLV